MDQQPEPIGLIIADLARLMKRRFYDTLGENQLTMAQSRALIFVSQNEGVRQVDLAELLEVKPITLARLLDQLMGEGLVERRQDPADRRAFRIYLTPAAQPYLDEIRAVGQRVRDRALRGLNREDAEAATKTLQRIRENLLGE